MVILRYPILPLYRHILFGLQQNLMDISRMRHDRRHYLQYTFTPASIIGANIIQNENTMWMVIVRYSILPLYCCIWFGLQQNLLDISRVGHDRKR